MERLPFGPVSSRPLLACLLMVLFGLSTGVPASWAQDASANPPSVTPPAVTAPAAAPAGTPPVIELASRQQQIFRDYERFEKALFDIAEQTRRKDPERAELLFRARGQSQEQRILTEMQAISELLKGDAKFGDALQRQQDLLPRMQAVLKLLQSLDDRDRINDQIAQVEANLKELNGVIANQKDVHADTQRGADPDRLSQQQQKVGDKARELAEKLDLQNKQREREEAERKGAGENQDPPPSGNPSAEGSPAPDKKSPMPGEQPPGGDMPPMPTETPMGADKFPMPADPNAKPSEETTPPPGEQPMPPDAPAVPSEGESRPGQPAPPQPGQPPQPNSPQQQPPGATPMGEQPPAEPPAEGQQPPAGREELEQARQEMQQALEELKGKDLSGAEKDQEAAIAKLEQAKAELEKILRQLREEEKEMYLTLLEARFQNMLRRQEQINSETTRLDGIAINERSTTFGAKVEVMKREQDDNVLDAGKALNLLREEGSSVAFPEAVEQMQQNMETVSRRLAKQDTGDTTQVIEQLIVETLEEMIFAMQQELEKQDEQKKQQQPGQPQPPEDPALVDQLAELKMIRSLQNQVNRLTKQVGLDVEGEQAVMADQLELLNDLAARQQRIQEATYDLSVGRNQ